jgi:hypothetical protein
MYTDRENQFAEIQQRLEQLRRRLRWRDGWTLGQQTLFIPALLGLAVQLAGRVFPIENLAAWTLAPFLLWLAAVIGYSALRPIPLAKAARRVDLEVGSKERLSTAYFFEKQRLDQADGKAYLSAFEPELVELQKNDALSLSRSLKPNQALPVVWLSRRLAAAGLIASMVLALAVLPNPMESVIQERREIAQEAQQQAERIEELREEIEKTEELSPELKEELLRQLAELAAQLRENPGDKAEALADLSRIEENLRRQLDPQAGMKQAALEALAAQLAELARGEQGEKGDLSKAAEDLQKLAEELANMDREQQQSLAQTLAQMAARAAQAGDMDLAQALSAMSQAAQSGDSQAAENAARQAGEAMARASSELSDQEALQRALSGVQSSRQSMAQSGREGTPVAGNQGQQGQGQGEGQGEGQGQGQGEGQGEGQGQGQGQGEGQGQGQGQGSPGGGGGTNAGSLPPGTSSGQPGRPQGEGQSGGIGDPGEQVFVPWERYPNSGDEVFIPGQDTGQGEAETRETRDPMGGANNPSLMPYYEVYESYLSSAYQNLDQNYYPEGLRDFVRQYFSQLEP